jgi:hypothetical protein
MSVLIISQGDSDLSKVLIKSAECTLLSFKEAENADLSAFSSIALLCGTEEGIPFTIPAALRIRIDEFAESGKPIFYEWCSSIGYTYLIDDGYNNGSASCGDAMDRYVYIGKDTEMLSYGDLLDSQANTSCVYGFIPKEAYPIMYNGGHILKHDHIEKNEISECEIEDKKWRLWYYDKNQLVCSFSISNFIRARFAPFTSWIGIIKIILNHLGIEEFEMPMPHYTLGSGGETLNTFNKGMQWFEGCDILVDNGRSGAE